MSAALLGRRVAAACVTVILTICFVAGSYVQATVNQLNDTHQAFNDRQLRNGYVAMSDVQRLVLIMQDAFGKGEMTPNAVDEFRSAADFLFVRTDTFRRTLRNGVYMESADNAVAQLQRVQDLVDHALATNFDGLPTLSQRLTVLSQNARQALVTYLDDMSRQQDRILIRQAIAVQNQRIVIWTTLAGLSVLGIVAIFLLRREVRAKQARQVAEERVRHLAFFDPLTGLPNRVHFQDRLGTLLEKQTSVALLLIDLDGFKSINDTNGHAAGDAILEHVSDMLRLTSDKYDGFASRLGGDEFSVFVQTDDLTLLKCICAEAIDRISQPIVFEGEKLQVEASIGLAMNTQISTQMDMNVDSLSRVADFALYASKSNGKRQFTVYDEALEQQFLKRRAMVEELPRAIADGSMEFFLQPKVDLATEQTYGFEALARWRRNDLIVPPHDFIATAEESGLITDIDYCVLRNATKAIADFNFINSTNFSISINFSTIHFNSRKLIDVVEEALNSSGLAPELLIIEITETIEMQDWDQAKHIIAAIHKLGAKISIDDFGAGFSSLAYLRTTVANEIKIDRSLIEDIETSDISRFLLDAVLDIARNLDLEVTVEGIETRIQADIVSKMGANNAQGYLFGRPMPKEEALQKAIKYSDHVVSRNMARGTQVL